jgi:hypothetical protein
MRKPPRRRDLHYLSSATNVLRRSSHSAAPLLDFMRLPVNDRSPFTGNCGLFAEYRVSTRRISLKIPPSNDEYLFALQTQPHLSAIAFVGRLAAHNG